MKFLAVLILIMWRQNSDGERPFGATPFVEDFFDWVDGIIVADTLRFVVGVLAPSLLLLWIDSEVSGWLFSLVGLVIAVVVLLFAIDDAQDLTVFADQRAWLREADLAADETEREHDRFCTEVVYLSFRGVVPAVFWFLVLGPAGALFYALSRRFEDRAIDDSIASIILFALEWLPARVAGLMFALLGDFRRGLGALLDTLTDTSNSVAITLGETARAAVFFSAAERSYEEELTELEWLLDRSLWGWVGLAALLTILGW